MEIRRWSQARWTQLDGSAARSRIDDVGESKSESESWSWRWQ